LEFQVPILVTAAMEGVSMVVYRVLRLLTDTSVHALMIWSRIAMAETV